MPDPITLDYRTCICRFDGMVCTVDVTCPIHHVYNFTREDVELLRELAEAYSAEATVSDMRADAGEALGDSGLWGINAAACGKRARALTSLTDSIEALLPPETP